MEKRHQDMLTGRLEDAWLNGVAHITWNELYRWYGVQKIAAKTYRDLDERWRALSEDENEQRGALMKVEGRGGIFIFGENSYQKVDSNRLVDQL
jgi:hypothetical protein